MARVCVLRARQSDVATIAMINAQFDGAFKEHGLKMPLPKYWDQRWVAEGVGNSNQFVLREGSNILGAMCLVTDKRFSEGLSDNEAYIESLAINHEMHSRGFGKRLIDFARKRAIKECKSELSVESFCLYDVKGFYLKCGFELDPEKGELKGYPYYRFFMKL
jgi:ribosomal protein S18 acetylase RimI-like enzyme